MEILITDIRYGLRGLLKRPGFTIIAVLTLALGIGANTAIFSLTDAVLLRQLPVRHPEQLVFLEQSGEQGSKRSSNLTYDQFEYLRDHNHVLANVCSFSYNRRINATVAGQAEAIEGQFVSGGFFSTLGVDAVAGRTFVEADDQTSSNQPVAVISSAYWKRRFALNKQVVGQSINFNKATFTIIGVAPADFHGAIIGSSPDVFIPSAASELILPGRFSNRNGPLAFVLGRLKPGINETQALADLTLLLHQKLTSEAAGSPATEKDQEVARQRIELTSAAQGFSALRRQFSKPLWFLMAVTVLVLLIACANVANLLLARASDRRKEIAVRLALGATRLRLIRQLLIESLLLAALGGGGGLLFAYWCNDLLIALFSSGRNPITAGARLFVAVPLDGRVLVFTILVSTLTGLLFGLAPAWQATRLELTPALNQNSRGYAGRRLNWGHALVVGQVALSLMLLIGAGLFVRSLAKLESQDLGFHRDSVLTLSVDPQLNGYRGVEIASLYKKMLVRIETLPGVASVSLSRQGLLNGGGTLGPVKVPGHTPGPDEGQLVQTREGPELNVPFFCQVGPRFFETAQMTIVRGRDFSPQDNETAPKVAVINETFASYYFGKADPIGRRFDRGAELGEVEIVGLVKDARYNNIRDEAPRTFYVPFLQDASSWRETSFLVRTTVPPLALVDSIRREVQALDPNLPIFRVQTLQAQVDESLGQERLVVALSSVFGLLALVLSCAGIYGVLSYSVSRRTREIGIRLALGAQRNAVLMLIVKQAGRLIGCGLTIGLLGALMMTRLLTSLLFGVSSTDAITFVGGSLLLAASALTACLVPARRATRVDPLVALRYE